MVRVFWIPVVCMPTCILYLATFLRTEQKSTFLPYVWKRKFCVSYIDIIAEDTVDTKIVKALRKKINIASEVYQIGYLLQNKRFHEKYHTHYMVYLCQKFLLCKFGKT